MTIKEYQKFANEGQHPNSIGKNQLLHFALGLAGETGEVCDDIKKREYHGRNIPIEHTKEEIGDVMWYVANICNALGFDLETILEENKQKLMNRYPEAYNGK